MIGATVAHLDPERGDLGGAIVPRHVDAGRARLAGGIRNTVFAQRADYGFLDLENHILDEPAGAAQIGEDVGNHLPWPMVCHLAATIGLDDGDIAWCQQVLGFASLAQRKDRVVLDKPDFVRGIRSARGGKRLHRLPDRQVINRPGPVGGHYSTTATMGWPCSAR